MHPFSDADVRELLGALRDFDVDLIAEELRAVDRLGGRLQRYAEFLSGLDATLLEPRDPRRHLEPAWNARQIQRPLGSFSNRYGYA